MPKIKIPSLFVSLSFSEFHRETTLRRPRQLPDTVQTEKVLFVKIPRLYTLHLTLYTLRLRPQLCCLSLPLNPKLSRLAAFCRHRVPSSKLKIAKNRYFLAYMQKML